MTTNLGIRGRNHSIQANDFSKVKPFRDIPTLSKFLPDTKKNKKIRELFVYLWCRCMNRNTGDCKFKSTDMAEVLGVTERSVYRYLDKLEKLGFISRLTKRRFIKQNHADSGVFNATRFIRVHAAVYHTYYNIVPSHTMCWDNDIRPDSSSYLKKIPLKYKTKTFGKMRGKFGVFEIAPRHIYNKSNVNLAGFYFQQECAQPGKDIVPVDAWHILDGLQDDADDMEGYPGQAKALKIIGRSFKDHRTRYVMRMRYDRKEKLAREATGFMVVKEPISASEIWNDFNRNTRRTA